MSEEFDRKFGTIPHDVWREQSALEVFRRMIAGELPQPPIARQFDFYLSEIETGRAVFSGAPKAEFYNPLGTAHGGYIATLLDSAMACAVHSTLEAGRGTTSVEIKINFTRPLYVRAGALKAVGETINVGKQIATAEGKLIDANGRLYAHGTTTCFIFDL